MKPALAERTVLSSGGGQAHAFGMSTRPEDLAQLFWILRDALYTNKILAVLREYSSNAWDAHRDVGKEATPIKVVLPTTLDPAVAIRDYGPGLSEEFMTTGFIQAGRSTKRGSDKVVGMLGIGRLSGFAYNDSFTVTSWHGGVKKMYHAVIDETNIGYIMKMHEEPCGDETGIEVKVPVNPDDIYTFRREAESLYRYFRPVPDINLALREPEFDWKTEHGFLRRSNGRRHADQWQAIMGCVPYRLNLDQIDTLLEEEGYLNAATQLSGGLYFEIGDVMISANREELQYTTQTKNAIIEKFKQVLEELAEEMSRIIETDETDDWSRRQKLREFIRTTQMPLKKEFREAGWGAVKVALYRPKTAVDALTLEGLAEDAESEDAVGLPKTFRLKAAARSKDTGKAFLRETPSIAVGSYTKLLIKDTIKPFRGFVEHEDERVVTIRDGHSVEAVEAELTKFLEEAKLIGVPVRRMSTMEYKDYAARTGKSPTDKVMERKHVERCFVLTGTSDRGALSHNWEIKSRTPDEDDVFVVINRFFPVGHFRKRGAPKKSPNYPEINGDQFYRVFRSHRSVLDILFKEEMPELWGLKTTSDKPVDRAKVVGTPYEKWIHKVVKEALARHPEVRAELEALTWEKLNLGDYPGWDTLREEQKLLKWLKTQLDGRHALPRFLRDRVAFAEKADKLNKSNRRRNAALATLKGLITLDESVPLRRYKTIIDRYPLLAYDEGINPKGFGCLAGKGREEWIRYINLIDSQGN